MVITTNNNSPVLFVSMSQRNSRKQVLDLTPQSRGTSLSRSIERKPPSKVKSVQKIDEFDFPAMDASPAPKVAAPERKRYDVGVPAKETLYGASVPERKRSYDAPSSASAPRRNDEKKAVAVAPAPVPAPVTSAVNHSTTGEIASVPEKQVEVKPDVRAKNSFEVLMDTDE